MAASRKPHHKVRSFVAGSVLGGLVVLAAPHARKRRQQLSMRGLTAFEGAPCTDARPDGTLPDAATTEAAAPPPAAPPAAPPPTAPQA